MYIVHCKKHVHIAHTTLKSQTEVLNPLLLQYLGIVEQRTNELLQLFAFVQAREAEKQEGAVVPQPPSLLGQGPQPQVNTITVAPPTTGFANISLCLKL